MPPCIFGFFSLTNNYPRISLPNGVVTLYRERNRVGIFKKGESKEIHFLKETNNFILVFGRLYAPFRINPHSVDTDVELRSFINDKQNKIQGSFVAVIKDFEQGTPRYILMTDKYGFRRMMYYFDHGVLYFSTHLSGLKILLNNNLPDFSIDALLHYYNFGFTPNDQTLQKGIKKIPPGSRIIVENHNYSIKPYFHIEMLYKPEEFERSSEQEISKRLDRALFKAINTRIINRDNIGLSLSGGVDSGYIAQKLMHMGLNPIGYNLSFKNYYDEFDQVDYLIRLLGLKVRKIILSPEQVINNFEECNSRCSEPVGFNNATMRFVALSAQQDGVSELFDGDGVDRLFLGMNRHLRFKKVLKSYDWLKKAKILNIIMTMMNMIPSNDLKKVYIHYKNWTKGIHPYPERKMGEVLKYVSSYEKRIYNIAIERFHKSFDQNFLSNDLFLYFSYQSIKMCPEMFFYDPSEIQAELDLFPIPAYWDNELVSLALSLPTKWKLHRGKSKYILRKAAAQHLTQKYWMMPKIGLQNSFNFVIQSKIGRDWHCDKKKKIKEMREYEVLKNIVPDGKVEKDRLINLLIWKEQNFLAK